jgi:hypothetical protein
MVVQSIDGNDGLVKVTHASMISIIYIAALEEQAGSVVEGGNLCRGQERRATAD